MAWVYTDADIAKVLASFGGTSLPAPQARSDYHKKHPVCDANCMKQVKRRGQMFQHRGRFFCDVECAKNFKGDWAF